MVPLADLEGVNMRYILLSMRERLSRIAATGLLFGVGSLALESCSERSSSPPPTKPKQTPPQGQHPRPGRAANTTVPIKFRRSRSGFLSGSLQYLVGSTRTEVLRRRYLDMPLSVYWVSDRTSSAPSGTILGEVVVWNPVFVPSESPLASEVTGAVTRHRGLAVTPGTEVGLTVAGGPENVRVPWVLGMSETSADHQIARIGLIPMQ
jgi:hypothetical protein